MQNPLSFKVLRKHFVQFCRPLWKTFTLPLYLPVETHSQLLLLIWCRLPNSCRCKKRVKVCLTSQLTFRSSKTLWVVFAPCSKPVSMEAYREGKDYFWMSWSKLILSYNFSTRLNECQVLVWKLSRKFLKKQLPSTSKEINIEKVRARELPKGIAITNRGDHRIDFLI